MTAIDPAPSPSAPLAEVVDRLVAAHGREASREEILDCVRSAWAAVGFFSATGDASMLALAERIAERDLLLRLGLERESARLDPERRSQPLRRDSAQRAPR